MLVYLFFWRIVHLVSKICGALAFSFYPSTSLFVSSLPMSELFCSFFLPAYPYIMCCRIAVLFISYCSMLFVLVASISVQCCCVTICSVAGLHAASCPVLSSLMFFLNAGDGVYPVNVFSSLFLSWLVAFYDLLHLGCCACALLHFVSF